MEALKNEKYISLEEAADYLGIRPVTLRSWVRDPKNEIPAHKIGRFWKFKCSEIDEWVNSGKSAIDK
ncbi:MAG: helix-turn-helix domain-containing protein [Oscillospiraceae bacterium]|nr:helix-turn-helix domain-containing protein [Oscillospiraceae bacterium]